MSIKAIIMDGDGSTITAENKVPDNLKLLIRNNPQVKWVIATGRSLEMLKLTPIFNYLSLDVPHIVDGGSCLMYLNGTYTAKYLLPQEQINALFKQLELDQVSFLYYSPDGKVSYAYSNQADFHLKFRLHSKYVTYTNDIQQFQTWLRELTPSEILLNTKSQPNLQGLYYQQNENNYDITANNINKGSACVELLQQLGLSPKEVAFVFNDLNDLPIVKNPLLTDIIKIKVGPALPDVPANFQVDNPYQVFRIITGLLGSDVTHLKPHANYF